MTGIGGSMDSCSNPTPSLTVESLVQQYVGAEYKLNAKYYSKIVEGNIQEVIAEVLETVRKTVTEQADKKIPKFSAKVLTNFLSFDKAMELFKQIVEKQNELTVTYSKIMSKDNYPISLYPTKEKPDRFGDELFNHYTHSLYDVEVSWKPENQSFGRKRFKAGAPSESAPSVLLNQFWNAAQKSDLTDLSFKVDDKIFPVHRNIISLRSDVLRAMINGKMKEASQNVIEIHETTPEAFEALLEFLYKGSVKPECMSDINSIGSIMALAHEYQVKELFNHCAESIQDLLLKKKLDAKTFKEFFLIGSMYNLEFLVFECLGFAEKSEEGQALLLSMVNKQNVKDIATYARKLKTCRIMIEQLFNKALELVESEDATKQKAILSAPSG